MSAAPPRASRATISWPGSFLRCARRRRNWSGRSLERFALALIGLAFGRRNQFELHAPRGEEVHPRLARGRALCHHGGLAKNGKAFRTQICDGLIDIVD